MGRGKCEKNKKLKTNKLDMCLSEAPPELPSGVGVLGAAALSAAFQ